MRSAAATACRHSSGEACHTPSPTWGICIPRPYRQTPARQFTPVKLVVIAIAAAVVALWLAARLRAWRGSARAKARAARAGLGEGKGELLVAEVKTGDEAPSVTTAATRRQLLEYHVAFGADGVLLVCPERKAIHRIVFPLRIGVRHKFTS